jgi:hypothetical protein
MQDSVSIDLVHLFLLELSRLQKRHNAPRNARMARRRPGTPRQRVWVHFKGFPSFLARFVRLHHVP